MKGTYTLLISVGKDLEIPVGALGKIFFQKGYYAYIGSAMNSLEHRIARHFKTKKKNFWHIDYLLENKNVSLEKAFYMESKKKLECETAKRFLEKGQAIQKFGCSDCKCKTHLFNINKKDLMQNIKEFKVF